MEIITNNRPRDLVSFYEMPEKEREKHKEDFENATEIDWFSYRGQWYCLDDFMAVGLNSPFIGWNGYSSDTFFSGTVIKLVDDRVIVGRYYS